MREQQQQQQIKLRASDADLKGVYSNLMRVTHSQEEFTMDFLNLVMADRSGTLAARVITSPGHFKRMIKAMQDNLQKYEEHFGKIAVAEEPKESEIGFKS